MDFERGNGVNRYSELFKTHNGPLVSSKDWPQQDKTDTDVYLQHREKSECALVATTSWYNGDVFGFGEHDLSLFRIAEFVIGPAHIPQRGL